MSSPYGPSGGGSDPQHSWGQQPSYGQQPGPQPGGSPAQQPPQYPQQPGYPQQAPPGYGQPQSGQPYPGNYPQQAQQSPGYAQQQQQPPYVMGPQRPERSGLIWIFAVAIVVIIAVVAILGFVWPGWFTQKVFDNSMVQTGIQQILRDNYKLNVSDVTCTGTHEVKVGSQFSCTATIDGKPKQVQVTVKSADGLYQVAEPQ